MFRFVARVVHRYVAAQKPEVAICSRSPLNLLETYPHLFTHTHRAFSSKISCEQASEPSISPSIASSCLARRLSRQWAKRTSSVNCAQELDRHPNDKTAVKDTPNSPYLGTESRQFQSPTSDAVGNKVRISRSAGKKALPISPPPRRER